jgi:hypothetical protein
MQKKRSALCSARTSRPTPPQCEEQTGVVGKLPWGEEQYSFHVHGNNGGARGVDCGILALRMAMTLLRDCPLAATFFTGSAHAIREELVQMFLGLNKVEQLCMARQYVEDEVRLQNASAGDTAALDSVREETIRNLRGEMLSWHTLVRYIQTKFPGQVNAVIWKQQPKGGVVLYEAGTVIIPDRPILHIIHYNALHFEALNPFEENAVECAIRGRVDDAKEYMIENPRGDIASLFTAPHPVERGHTLVQFESVVYKCENGHAIMRSLAGIAPMSPKASCSFNYNEAKPIPGWMLESVNDFTVMQGLGHLGL